MLVLSVLLGTLVAVTASYILRGSKISSGSINSH